MDVQRLVTMANDIARYFASEPDREAAVEAVADHLRKFWTPAMREQLVQHLEDGAVGLDDLSSKAVRRLGGSMEDSG